MRRPLSDAGLVFILLLFIIQLLSHDSGEYLSAIDRDTVTISGILVKVETRVSYGEESPVFYVRDPLLYDKSSNTFQKILRSRKDTVMCYMSGDVSRIGLGYTVTLTGRAGCFMPPTNPGMFDFRRYYSIMRVGFRINGATVSSFDDNTVTPYWRLRANLDRIRRNISYMCDLTFTPEDASLIKGIMLGDRSSVDPEQKSLYSRNGIAHILAISGLHISMLGMGISALLKKTKLPTAVANSSVILLIILYGIMTGMAASAFRAIVMFSLRMTAGIIHRTYDMATALVIAAFLILIDQPAYLFYSGFQFSFGAMAAVLLILPILEDSIHKLMAGGVSITVVTLPVYLHNYYYFPLLSMLINLYVIPLMSLLLGSCIIALAGCALYIPAGRTLAVIPHLILKLYDYSCRLCDMFKWNRLVTGKPGVMSTIIYILIIVLILILHKRMTSFQILLNLIGAGIILTLNLHTGISVTVIDVGQGDGIFITDNIGTDILIDSGSTTVRDVGKNRISPFLYSRGVAALDAVFITHLDADHYNGILELINDGGKNYPRIDHLYLTSSAASGDSAVYHTIVESAQASSIPIHIVTSGDTYKKGNLKMKCLYPDEMCDGSDTNAESLVMHLRSGNIHMLFTGDLEESGEDALNRIIPEEVKPEDMLILKVAHHGSKYSTYDKFLDLTGPDIALISSGEGNSYGHPHRELTDRLDTHDIPWFNTADHGALMISIRGDAIKIDGFKDDR